MMTEEEKQQFNNLKQEVENLKKVVGHLTYPLDPSSKGAIEQMLFFQLKALIFKGGLPIFTTARDVTVNRPSQGEIWLEDVSGPTRRICVYISGTKYVVAVT
ncbi:MAG: hypothetical protein [Siphoviridae sp. cttb18]|nr:MAG: hypothetical protein [Siphoviridae sp. cttb18]